MLVVQQLSPLAQSPFVEQLSPVACFDDVVVALAVTDAVAIASALGVAEATASLVAGDATSLGASVAGVIVTVAVDAP